MVVAPLSPAEYLREEAKSPEKREYIDGEVVAMAGASRNHGLISSELPMILPREVGFRYLNSDVKVYIAPRQSYLYPDACIACPPHWTDEEKGAIDNPVAIFEVLSPGTELRDRTTKFDLYALLPSVREIVFIASERRSAETYLRTEDGRWLRSQATGGMLRLVSLGGDLDLDRLYDGVQIQEPDLSDILKGLRDEKGE
ncbi:Uma2 family endonuclease [bacterium]|nr:MAG: Uma2 family endonuclease [bacterium]